MNTEKLSAKDSAEVLDFLGRRDIGRPFQEEESYCSRSSHCRHDVLFEAMHGVMQGVFEKARAGDHMYRAVAANLEKVFIIGYTVSALYDELYSTDGVVTNLWPSRHPKWFHGPFPGGWITLDDKWDGDPRVPIGCVLKSSNDLKTDPLVTKTYEAYKDLVRIRQEKTDEFQAELLKVYEMLKGILEQIVTEIKECCT